MTANKPNTIVLFVIIGLLAFFALTTNTGCATMDNASSNDVMRQTQHGTPYINCGTCGAHVLEWWAVRNDANTEWVYVCSKCYDRMEG